MIPFCTVQGGAATQTDQGIDPQRGGEPTPGLDHRGVRVDVEVVKRHDVDAGLSQPARGRLHVAGRHEAAVRHQERSA